MATATKKPTRTRTLKVRVVGPKVNKADRTASVKARAQVRTKTDIDFVKSVRGR